VLPGLAEEAGCEEAPLKQARVVQQEAVCGRECISHTARLWRPALRVLNGSDILRTGTWPPPSQHHATAR
jgi:hypothetical protein